MYGDCALTLAEKLFCYSRSHVTATKTDTCHAVTCGSKHKGELDETCNTDHKTTARSPGGIHQGRSPPVQLRI